MAFFVIHRPRSFTRKLIQTGIYFFASW